MRNVTHKKLAIIGANEAITMLITKAKEIGYETHVFAWQCGDPGEKAADFFYPISVSDKESILAKCKEIGVCGVCSITSDFAAPVVSYVARNLGLPGNPERTDILARNKFEMRKALKEEGSSFCPQFTKVSDLYDIDSIKDFKYPLIVKPTDRWSSKGVTRVDSFSQLNQAVNVAVSESLEGKAIIEEYMEGPEYSAECIVYNGKVEVLAFTKKMTTGYPHYIETGHLQPSDIPVNKQNKYIETIKKAIKALDITNSAAHVEFKVLDTGEIGIIEIGARMGGDCIGTDLTPISTGMDYIKMVIDVACGNKPDFSIVTKPHAVGVSFIINQNDIDDFNLIKKDKILRKSQFDNAFAEVIDSSTRHGYYIFRI